MSRLSLSLLGPVRVAVNDQQVTFEYTKVRALLIYLAVEHQHAHQRDALAELLWPEQPPQVARNSLRQALAKLRQAIGDHAATPPFLIISRETLQFNSASSFTLDTAIFSELLAACARHQHDQTCATCTERRVQAVELYRGPFLDGGVPRDSAAFEEWALAKREWFASAMLDALVQLADGYEAAGATGAALVYARRQLDFDPWREAAHRQIMRVQVRTGDRRGALAQYEQCRRVLQAELGIAPEDETTALYEQIASAGAAKEHAAESMRYPLPPQPTTFIGRAAELAELGALLRQPACRLISLLGPGGIGKTRLALQAAEMNRDMFADGVCWIPLAGLVDPAYLVDTIVRALGCLPEDASDQRAHLLGWLADKQVLLVLDNFEHLLAGAELLVDMLTHAPNITLLVTTRERLQLQWEWLLDVEGLRCPETAVQDAAHSEAVELFIQRAKQVRRRNGMSPQEYAAIVQICWMVEGMPLALEMAAAASREQSYQTIAHAITGGLDALHGSWRDQPDRHQSMRIVCDHSWQMLSPAAQHVFMRLSVFRGGIDREAATQVAGATAALLEQFVQKSFLRHSNDGRYGMHELLRQFAAEHLSAVGDPVQTNMAHLKWVVELAETAEPHLVGTNQEAWLRRLDNESDNLRVALQWACDQGDGVNAARVCSAIWRFWWIRGHIQEGRDWFAKVLEHPLPKAVRAKALRSASGLAFYHNDIAQARAYNEQVVELYREINDQPELARTLDNLGIIINRQGEYARARSLFEEALAIDQRLGDKQGVAFALGNLAETAYFEGDYAESVRQHRQSLVLHRELGDQHSVAIALINIGEISERLGDHDDAACAFAEAVTVTRQIGATYVLAVALNNIGHMHLAARQFEAARAAYAEALPLLVRVGEVRVVAEAFAALATVAQAADAVSLLAAAQHQLDANNAQLDTVQKAEYDNSLAQTRGHVNQLLWEQAWHVGYAMTLAKAITFALAAIPNM